MTTVNEDGELVEVEQYNHKAEIIRDDHQSSEIDGDDSIPYESWNSYIQAVEDGKEHSYVEQNRIEEKNKKIAEARRFKSGSRKKYSFNVDKALDCIDLTFPNYTPSKQAYEFFNIIRLVLGEEPEVASSTMHYFLIDLVFGNIKRENFPFSEEIQDELRINHNKIAIIASRRSAKSTVLTAFLPIYVAITGKMPGFGDVLFWVSFGDSQQAGAKVQANTIRDICEDSEFCKGYFEKMRFTDEECEFIRAGSEKIIKRSFMFKVKGAAGGSVRGIRYRTKRPDILTFDDIIKTEADARSEIIMSRLKSMIYSDAESAMGRKGKIIIVNTPFTKKDPVYSALENGVWTPMCIPMCEKIDLDLEEKDFVGSWPQMNDYEWAIERYADAYYGGTLRELNQELMLRIAAEEDKLIKKDQIQWYSRRHLEKFIGNYKLVATTDYTASNTVTTGDYSGTIMWAVSSSNEWFMLDLSLKRMTIDGQYEPLFNMVSRYIRMNDSLWVEAGVETNGQQQVNIYALKQLMVKKNIYFSFSKQIGKPRDSEGFSRSGSNKHGHFMRVHPLFQNKKIFFPEELRETKDMEELLEELNGITYTALTAVADDGIDTISAIGLLDITLPVKQDEEVIEHEQNRKNNPIWGDIDFDKEYKVNSGCSTVF